MWPEEPISVQGTIDLMVKRPKGGKRLQEEASDNSDDLSGEKAPEGVHGEDLGEGI